MTTYFVLPELHQFLEDRGVMNEQLSSVLRELEKDPTKLVSKTKGKRKTKSGRKTPVKTGYNIYQKEYYAKIKQEHPEFSPKQVIIALGATWTESSAEFKAAFTERADALKREQEDASSGVSETSDAEDSGAEASTSKKPVAKKAEKPAAKKPAAKKAEKAKQPQPQEEKVPSDVDDHDEFDDEFNDEFNY